MTLYAKTLQHLIWMAQMPGAKAHACMRALELEADPSGLWDGIAGDLTSQVAGLEKVMASVAQRLTKPR
jgi:hypothetical protein